MSIDEAIEHVLTELKGPEKQDWIACLREMTEQTLPGKVLVERVLNLHGHPGARGYVIGRCEALLVVLRYQFVLPWEVRFEGRSLQRYATFAEAQADAQRLRLKLSPERRGKVTVSRIPSTPLMKGGLEDEADQAAS